MTHRTIPTMNPQDLANTIHDAIARGPIRVVVDREAYGVSPQRALGQGIVADVIFVRDDGWTLGAPTDLIDVALATWPEEWAAVINVQTKQWRHFDAEWKAIL